MEPNIRARFPLSPEENQAIHNNNQPSAPQRRATVRSAADVAQVGQSALSQREAPTPTRSSTTRTSPENSIPGNAPTRAMPGTSAPSAPLQHPSTAAAPMPSATSNRAMPRSPASSIFESSIPMTSAKPPIVPKPHAQNRAMPRTTASPPPPSTPNPIPQPSPIPMASQSYFERSRALPRNSDTEAFSTFFTPPPNGRPGVRAIPRVTPTSSYQKPIELIDPFPTSGSSGNNSHYNNGNNSSLRNRRFTPSPTHTPLYYKILSVVMGCFTSIALWNAEVPIATAIGIGFVVTVLMHATSPKRPVRQTYL